MKAGDRIQVRMQDYVKWLHAHHDVRNHNHTEDMYTFAGVDPVHHARERHKRSTPEGFVMLEIVDPRKYLAAKLRYGI
jgi:hypothetical protein